MSQRSDLPFGSEFSPSQIDLPELLELVEANQGNSRALEDAIRVRYFMDHGQSDQEKDNERNRRKLANNCKLGLIAYQIIERDTNFTAFGQLLYSLRHDMRQLYDALAKHILLHLNGMNLVQCISDMTAAGEEVNLVTLREGMALRGIHLSSGTKSLSSMRLWLALSGVFVGRSWRVDDLRLHDVLGINPNQFEVLANFTQEQRAFVRALANTGITTSQRANEIALLATTIYGTKFPEKSLPKLVLDDLEEAGYIHVEKTTSGRGSRSPLVTPTAKLITDIIDPLLDQLANQIDPKLRELLKKSLSTILEEVKSDDRYIAGLALEALAFKLMRLIDMEYLATRLRGTVTGGAEVDLIFQSTRLVYSRWQIQCKNTRHVALDDVAKEVGLTQFLKSNVIVMVSTGDIGNEARRYANIVMAQTNLAIVMIDRADLTQIIAHPVSIVDVFSREAQSAMRLRKLELEK